MSAKIAGQRAVFAELPGASNTAAVQIDHALRQVDQAVDLAVLLAAEAHAACVYWQARSEIYRSRSRRGRTAACPSIGRHSASVTHLSNGPRLATNPAGAILNYLYSLLEVETVLACHTVGLDPGFGLFQTDRRDRASLALDLTEPLRPTVDAYLLALLTQRTLAARDFIETRQGACRLSLHLAAQLAETVGRWRHHVAAVVERAAHMFAAASPRAIPQQTPLTRRNHRDAWDECGPDRQPRVATGRIPRLPVRCRDCGAELLDRRRRHCDDCRSQRWAGHAVAGRRGPRATTRRTT